MVMGLREALTISHQKPGIQRKEFVLYAMSLIVILVLPRSIKTVCHGTIN
jgi:hypothetical protein